MIAKWTLCETKKPDDERQVLLAHPHKSEVEAGHWLEPEQAWVLAGTHIQTWPTFWRDMPKSPMNHE
ncbi:hypothetical protein [Epibacterium sp. Ofav1-8]|uniref:hypothetical protein n=1 Tax=Epibacterium sp. Ofav1-8 TaxID=2917735 RepID=UPI001EF5C33F|nr:hypothetical protein [Epibacterium sp. Ofav1-8]MCG7625573.1 hypothetical protein [Epibacterium sp. Ofav1-8]